MEKSKENKVLTINENFRIETDTVCSRLIKTQTKERINKITGLNENYIIEESFYYPNVFLCLKAYLLESQENAENVIKCIENTEIALKEIKQLLTNYK